MPACDVLLQQPQNWVYWPGTTVCSYTFHMQSTGVLRIWVYDYYPYSADVLLTVCLIINTYSSTLKY